uniref:Uncharacterized protein n=2 Tax=unclassified Caudoviricetes TaxID=2788787 RepID=A0A8S5VI90_9CAUD|nr:MAG TPA: hypothetical protein [Siphoviridae sp. ctBtT10]DAG06319.1 MAG TPA: hypothetical protein [Siphoviridae sp. ctC4e1]DAP44852.1 MAG TPA: hypothetical protein [Caudoviricetes sp.]
MILFNCSHIYFSSKTLYIVKQMLLLPNMLCFSVIHAIIIFD